MKVLHFYKTYLPDTIGGVENVIFEIIKGTTSLGVFSEVMTLTKEHASRTYTYEGHTVHRCRSNFEFASTPFSFSALYRLKRISASFDLIHYHFPYPFADMLQIFGVINKPYVVTYHSDIVKQKKLLYFYRPLKDRFLSSAVRIVATSPNYLASSPILSKYKGQTEVIPIGISESNYPKASAEKVNFWRDQVGSQFFLFVGVLRYYKGLYILLDAAKNVDFSIVIVGSGPIESELKVKATEMGLTNVIFLGQLEETDKAALFELCLSVVFPSHLRSEAFGVALLEGAMYGKPLISSEIGTGTSYININSVTGLVIPPSDPLKLAEAMTFLWLNPVEAQTFGLNARDRYLELFTCEKMAGAYLKLYEEAFLDQSKEEYSLL